MRLGMVGLIPGTAGLFLLLPLLTSCGESTSLSNSNASAMILASWQRQICPNGTTPDSQGTGFSGSFRGAIDRRAGAGNRDYEQVTALDAWFARTVENQPATYTLISDRRTPCSGSAGVGGCSRNRTYRYMFDGAPMSVTYEKSDSFTTEWQGFFRQTSAQVRFCRSVPDTVQVLDITIDPQTNKRADVTYTLTWKFTPLADSLNKAGIFSPLNADPEARRNSPSMADSKPQNRHASFQRLDTTGWQIAGSE